MIVIIIWDVLCTSIIIILYMTNCSAYFTFGFGCKYAPHSIVADAYSQQPL